MKIFVNGSCRWAGVAAGAGAGAGAGVSYFYWTLIESVVVSCIIWTFGPNSKSTLMQVTTIFF